MRKKPITEVVEEKIQEELIVEETPVVKEPVKKEYIGIAQVRVNVRESADSNSNIIKVLDQGDTIKVVEKKATKGFYPVDGGFVMKEYLDIKEV